MQPWTLDQRKRFDRLPADQRTEVLESLFRDIVQTLNQDDDCPVRPRRRRPGRRIH